MPTLNELGQSLRSQLSEIVSGGDTKIVKNADSFITWCTPGIPYEAHDFEFAAKGLGSGATAEDEKRMVNQAFNFATMVDFIPDASGLLTLDKQVAVMRTSQARLSFMYGEILRLSKVLDQGLTEEQQKKLDNWRSKLRVTKKVKDLITDEEKEVTEDSPAVKLYNEFAKKYSDAKMLYNSKRIAAQTAAGPEGKAAVLDWENNQGLYRSNVDQAAGEWASSGFHHEVDELRAAINQRTERSLKLWKQRLENYLDDARLSALGPGQTFLYTTPIPGTFAASDEGWTNYEVHSTKTTSDMETHAKSWTAGGSLGFGFWKAGADGSGHSQNHSENVSIDKFSLKFSLAQILISRAWLFPEFFMNRGWTLDPGSGWTYEQFPSDGQNPPNGNFVGYPTSIIFARDIKIESAQFASHFRTFSKDIKAGGSGGWGPFTLKGSYSRSDSGRHFDSEDVGQILNVPGMQILGFVNRLIAKSPNPLPQFKPGDFS